MKFFFIISSFPFVFTFESECQWLFSRCILSSNARHGQLSQTASGVIHGYFQVEWGKEEEAGFMFSIKQEDNFDNQMMKKSDIE